MVLCMVGTGMLWVGWYGFNAGSALGADGIAANAFMTTTLAAGDRRLRLGRLRMDHQGQAQHPRLLLRHRRRPRGRHPRCGFVTASGAMIIGVLAGVIPFLACWKLKQILGYDDALDTFGVHGVGGTWEPPHRPPRRCKEANPSSKASRKASSWNQIKACALTIVWSVVATLVIAIIVKIVVGLPYLLSALISSSSLSAICCTSACVGGSLTTIPSVSTPLLFALVSLMASSSCWSDTSPGAPSLPLAPS
jgi:Amt family ammonium transporter